MRALTPPELDGWTPEPLGYKAPMPPWRYMELKAAHFWGMSPWDFDAMEPAEKAEATAFMLVNQSIESYHSDMATKKTRANK